MDRIPLLSGKTTPSFADKILSAFGNNPHREPLYRLIWSERKQIWFMGEIAPEYIYLDPPRWILEVWLDPEKDAGPRSAWNPVMEALSGPYPSKGTYNYAMGFEPDWQPTEAVIQTISAGLQMSRGFSLEERVKAIREVLEDKAKLKREEVANTIVESFDSAAMGRIQQAASGPKNTFRTPEDFERDQEKLARLSSLPKVGGKVLQENA